MITFVSKRTQNRSIGNNYFLYRMVYIFHFSNFSICGYLARLSTTSLLRFGIFANVSELTYISDNVGLFLDEDDNFIVE